MWMHVLLSIIVIYLLWKYYSTSSNKLPPGPKGLPILGSVSGFSAQNMFDHLEKYGEVSSFVILGTRFVVLNSISALYDAYMNPPYATVFSARTQMFIAKYVLKRCMTFSSPTDPEWNKQRQLIQEAIVIRGHNIDKIEDVITSELNYVIEILKEKACDPDKVSDPDLLRRMATRREFDIRSVIAPSLINIILILVIGERVDYNHPLCVETEEMLAHINNLVSPFSDFILTIFPFIRYFPVGLGKTYQNLIRNVRTVYKYVLDDSRKKLEVYKDSCEGFAYNILRQQQQCEWITEDILRGSIFDVIGPAHGTTRIALYSFFLIMINYPNIQKNIQEEIDNNVGDRKPRIKDRKIMAYTEAVILELMRYATIVPLSLPHECSQTVTFRGFTIPKHAIILNNIWKCHMGDHWENPWTFIPERFLDDFGELIPNDHPNRKNLLPFGLGKRHCVGELFAKNRIFLYITTILQVFNILPGSHLPSADPRDFEHLLNLSPCPYKLQVQLRDNAK